MRVIGMVSSNKSTWKGCSSVGFVGPYQFLTELIGIFLCADTTKVVVSHNGGRYVTAWLKPC